MDDILIFLRIRKEHDKYVRLILRRLREFGLQIDLKKYEFGV